MEAFRVSVCSFPQNAPYRLFVDRNNMEGLLQAIWIYAARFAGNRMTERRQGLLRRFAYRDADRMYGMQIINPTRY